jgi:hypothetical protein
MIHGGFSTLLAYSIVKSGLRGSISAGETMGNSEAMKDNPSCENYI